MYMYACTYYGLNFDNITYIQKIMAFSIHLHLSISLSFSFLSIYPSISIILAIYVPVYFCTYLLYVPLLGDV